MPSQRRSGTYVFHYTFVVSFKQVFAVVRAGFGLCGVEFQSGAK